MKFIRNIFIVSILYIIFSNNIISQEHSVVRQWNEVLLEAIRNDQARPTVHARNLFHTSAAMYDAWVAIDGEAEPYFLNREHNDVFIAFDGFNIDSLIADSLSIEQATEIAISHAAFRIIQSRFRRSPGVQYIFNLATATMLQLGNDPQNISTDYSSGDPAALGNFIAEKVIEFGFNDNSNERFDYRNLHYLPSNPSFAPKQFGNETIVDYNRWQPLSLDVFIDQSGNVRPGNTPAFLSPEWGAVTPFALQEDELSIYNRDGFDYYVYHDPGPPPYIEDTLKAGDIDHYKWGFCMVTAWGSHLDPDDGVMIDISPAAQGNNNQLPMSIEEFDNFYDFENGGDLSTGRTTNPKTGEAYEPNIVPMGDYTRVLAEFWADGPDSETPPGHWFTILNTVMDHPEFTRDFEGVGEELDTMEYELKAYFLLGGAMHDAAITAWGIKGWYDYLRPVSAIRAMAELGQSTDSTIANYHPNGLPLIDGYIEMITADDHNPPYLDTSEIIVRNNQPKNLIGEIKVKSWAGPDHVLDPESDVGGVQWIPAGKWWPYQRPTFITPNFAGYVSGHSTYSRAAAVVLEMLTGDEYFPGGMAEFIAEKDKFLVFEKGPSEDISLQWATYKDASDQTSLSRIWGGIHPPADDIPGRLIGEEIGESAFRFGRTYFNTSANEIINSVDTKAIVISPNPVVQGHSIQIKFVEPIKEAWLAVTDMQGRRVRDEALAEDKQVFFETKGLATGSYIINIYSQDLNVVSKIIITD